MLTESTRIDRFLISGLNPDHGDDEADEQAFWIGLMVSLVTNFVQAFAMAFQRKSHIINDQLSPVELQKPSYRRPMWVAAATTYLVANIIGSVFSIGYLPIVTLAPISALGLVFNAFAAWGVLGDPLTRRSVLGTGSIVIGTLLVGLFGVIIEPDHDIDDLIQLYHKTTFIIYFSILEFVIVTALIFTHYFEQLYFKLQKQNFMPDQPRLKWLASADFRMYLGISYGMIAGNISSQSMLFAKSGFELFILTIVFNMDQLHYPLTWVLVSMVIVTAILQLYYLNKGLRLCDTVILVPLSSCAFNVSCLFNGLVYYDQWSRLRWEQIIMVTLGVSLIICGVLILSWRGGTSTAHLQENTVTEAALVHSDSFIDEAVPAEDMHEGSSSGRMRHTSSEPNEKTRLLKKR